MDNNEKIDRLIAGLPGATRLSALQLNDIRFSGRKTVITPSRLRQTQKKPAS